MEFVLNKGNEGNIITLDQTIWENPQFWPFFDLLDPSDPIVPIIAFGNHWSSLIWLDQYWRVADVADWQGQPRTEMEISDPFDLTTRSPGNDKNKKPHKANAEKNIFKPLFTGNWQM